MFSLQKHIIKQLANSGYYKNIKIKRVFLTEELKIKRKYKQNEGYFGPGYQNFR